MFCSSFRAEKNDLSVLCCSRNLFLSHVAQKEQLNRTFCAVSSICLMLNDACCLLDELFILRGVFGIVGILVRQSPFFLFTI